MRLPETWDDSDEEDEAKKARYQELASRLKSLDDRRKELREKVAVYKMVKELLEPFENPTETVQGNLVARGGELERELEKMRLLVARVRGRVEGLPADVDNGVVEDLDVDLPDEGKKLEALI